MDNKKSFATFCKFLTSTSAQNEVCFVIKLKMVTLPKSRNKH